MGNGQSAETAVSPEVMEKCTLPPEAVKALIKAFRRETTGKKGPAVRRQDFLRVLAALPPDLRGGSVLFDHADALFDTLDTNHGGTRTLWRPPLLSLLPFSILNLTAGLTVDLDELLLGLSVLSTGTMEEKATLTFKAMDADNSGSLNQGEVKKQCEKLYKMLKAIVGNRIRFIVTVRYGNSIPPNALAMMDDTSMDQALASMKKGLVIRS